MDKIGFIGYGSMGSMLVKCLINAGKCDQNNILVTRKNKDRLSEVTKAWPQMNVTEYLPEVTRNSKYIYLCMKPAQFYDVLTEIKPYITPDKHLISITSAISIQDIEQLVSCKITKILPTIISEAGEGITLICHNNRVCEKEAMDLEEILGSFSSVSRVQEDAFGFASQFTSSGPGFYAALLEEFVNAGIRYSNSLSKEQIIQLVSQTIYGTTKLIMDNSMSFTDVVSRVAVKGGITEEGVKTMQSGLPQVFDEVFEHTMGKRKLVDEKLHNQFLKHKSII